MPGGLACILMQTHADLAKQKRTHFFAREPESIRESSAHFRTQFFRASIGGESRRDRTLAHKTAKSSECSQKRTRKHLTPCPPTGYSQKSRAKPRRNEHGCRISTNRHANFEISLLFS